MSDSEPQLPREQEDAVRRLLGEARVTDPMPDDVAERLDDVVAGLDAERGTPEAGAVSLEARRRRRRAASLVLAAAAVVVAGVGVGQLIGEDAGGGGDTLSVDSPAEREIPPADRDGEAPSDLAEGDAAEEFQGETKQRADALDRLAPPRDLPIARVSRQRFAEDVRRVRAALPDRNQPATHAFRRLDTGSLPDRLVASRDRLSCGAERWGAGVLVPVVFAGEAGVLAFRPPTRDTQVVDVLQCGSGQTLHSTTLPIR